MLEITARQEHVLATWQAFEAQHDRPPTVRELRGLLGVASTATVHKHLLALTKKGKIVLGMRGVRLFCSGTLRKPSP